MNFHSAGPIASACGCDYVLGGADLVGRRMQIPFEGKDESILEGRIEC